MIRMLLLTALMLGPAAGAQIALPGAPLPGLPGGLPGSLPGGLPDRVGLPDDMRQAVDALTSDANHLEDARKLSIRRLLRRHPDVLEADPSGDPILRGEVLAFSPTDAALARARGAGFSIRRERPLSTLGVHIVVLGAPRGMPTRRALSWLRRSDPAGTYDFNNIYTESGAATGGRAMPSGAGDAESAAAVPLGLIDGGVGTRQPVFRGIAIHQHGCGGTVVPSAHGTEVASLMVGRSVQFGGAAPGATLFAADVYCGKPTGGAVDAIAEALAWLVGQRAAVINISLVGPPNALLQQLVARVVGQGILIVAAVGNDGPAAAPLYPAAYPGVVGVTAVDDRRRAIFEAERGPQVMFAAPGADIVAATVPEGFEAVRGTSFAAPIVAGLLARHLYDVDPQPVPAADSSAATAARSIAAARGALDAMARDAVHLGAAGRNTVFGYGLVGAKLPWPRPASRE